MESKPRASVIVCTYDESRMNDVEQCIASLLKQNFNDFEVLMVVDHNEKLYAALVEKYCCPKVKVLLNDSKRIGQASTMNFGVKNSCGEIVCFIDDDVVVGENWLSELINAYDDGALAVGGRIEPLWANGKPDYLPEEFYWMVGVTGSYLPGEVGEVRNLWSGNISYMKAVFSKIGLFTEELGRAKEILLQGEDAEFGLRLMKVTRRGIKYVPTAIVYHKVNNDRMRLGWLLRRAYWQGCAKAHITRRYGGIEALSTERGYLILLSKSSLRRLKRVMLGPGRVRALKQLAFTLIAMVTVFLGFLNGLQDIKYEN